MRLSLLKLLSVLILASVLFSCAKRGTPTGGAKDTIPPVLQKAIPSNETVNFKEKKIRIYFDEYVKLKDVNTQLIISPPQKNEPIITPTGTASKFITIKILDTLDANTTYLYNFGNSIVDYNEENELGNFKYVFSTGSYIDSLEVRGEVTDPSVKGIVKDLDIMLYEYDTAYTDSIIFKQKPRYLSNTLDTSLYEITNVKKGKYLLMALKDANNNKIYDPEIDKIGYIEDTVIFPTDSVYNFTIFKEIPKLSVIKPKEVNSGHLIFGYKGKANDLIIELLSDTPDDFKSEIIYEANKDTINFWYTPFEADSLNFTVSKGEYYEEFTANLRSSKKDTLRILNGSGNTLNLRDTLSIISNTPIIKVDTSFISVKVQDSIKVDFQPILAESKTKLYLNFDRKPDSKYAVEILPKAITDIYKTVNDTLTFNATTKLVKDYGIINTTIKSKIKSSFIIELIDSKEKVVRVAKLSDIGTVQFELLEPGVYFVRVTTDINNNGIWDTGNFLEKRQPEKIKFFDKEIELKANFELNETFTVD
ncbi:Ig-like domain-containing protein [Lutibacter sp. A80]|uniref:Ig-like domain-containing protein n=1 Tax=Lutibacter sp. A80 TaxID=2918453 RepID=UPI001F06214C|nr:Ig-like domain-containing protein [Lutibacter sp. A80]UMB59734.1 Ig-like domain-containing protein [Lutibacter sp. A80]